MQVGKQLAVVGSAIEASYGNEPQDIEGGLVPSGKEGAPQLMIFQTRPQH